MIIYLDYDGTVVEHMWPLEGPPVPYCLDVLQRLQDKNYKIILNTKRVELDRASLQRSIDYLHTNHINVSTVRITKLDPGFWAPQLNMDYLFLDDICAGIPLMKSTQAIAPMVDWKKVEKELKRIKII